MGLAWIKSPKKDMAVPFFNSPLEYYLIKPVGPRKKAQISRRFNQRMH